MTRRLFSSVHRRSRTRGLLTAALPPCRRPQDMTLAQWNHTLSVNLTASFLIIREYLRQLEVHQVTDNVAIVLIGCGCAARPRPPSHTTRPTYADAQAVRVTGHWCERVRRSTAGKFGEAYHAGMFWCERDSHEFRRGTARGR